MSTALEQARQIFRRRGGTLRTREALAAGIHPRTLYALRDAGMIEPLARGVYHLAEMVPLADPDLTTVAKRIPRGVICLLSALAFHDLTTRIPHAVDVALPRSAWTPRLEYPPIRVHHFALEVFPVGIENHTIDGVDVRVYAAARTLADCFKFRNRIGLDVFMEGLRAYRLQPEASLQRVLEFARVCRVANVMRPYLEASV